MVHQQLKALGGNFFPKKDYLGQNVYVHGSVSRKGCAIHYSHILPVWSGVGNVH